MSTPVARRYRRRDAVAEPSLAQFVLLSMLLHILLVLMIGTAEHGAGGREGGGRTQDLDVALAPYAPETGYRVRVLPGAGTDRGDVTPARGAAAPRPPVAPSRGVVPPPPAARPVTPPAAESSPLQESAPAAESLPRLDRGAPEIVDKAIEPLPEPVAPEVPAETIPRLEMGTPRETPRAVEPAAPTAAPAALPREAPAPVLPLATPVPPPVVEPEVAPVVPLTSPIEAPAVVAPRVAPEAPPALAPEVKPTPVPPAPVEVPPPVLPSVEPAPPMRAAPETPRQIAPEPVPRATPEPPPVVAPPVVAPPIVAPPIVAPPTSAPSAPQIERETPRQLDMPPAPATTPTSTPAPAPVAPRAVAPEPASRARDLEAPRPAVAPTREAPSLESLPKLKFGEDPEDIFKPRTTPPTGVVPPPGQAPRLNLEAAKKSSPEIGRSDGRKGIFNIESPPPEPVSKLGRAIQKAAQPDCRDAYAAMGLLAVPFLLKDTITDTGCRW